MEPRYERPSINLADMCHDASGWCPVHSALLKRLTAAVMMADPGREFTAEHGLDAQAVFSLLQRGFTVSLIGKGWYRVSWAREASLNEDPVPIFRSSKQDFSGIPFPESDREADPQTPHPLSPALKEFLRKILTAYSQGATSEPIEPVSDEAVSKMYSTLSLYERMFGAGSILRRIENPDILPFLDAIASPYAEHSRVLGESFRKSIADLRASGTTIDPICEPMLEIYELFFSGASMEEWLKKVMAFASSTNVPM